MRLLAEERRTWWRDERTMRRFAGPAVLEPDDYAGLEEQIDAARRGSALAAALDSLSARDRDLFLLVAEEELPVAEAARALGVTPVAGRMRLRRARLKLKGAFEAPERVPISEAEGSSS